jgi:glutathione S-transferase
MKLYELCSADRKLRFSPHCWKIRLALAHKGLNPAYVPIGFTEIGKITPGPGTTLPILEDSEHVVHDSLTIADYLDENYPEAPPLFPDESSRSYAKFVEGWVNRVIHPLISQIVLLNIHGLISPEDQVYFRTSREKRNGKTLEDVVAQADVARAGLVKSLSLARHVLADQPFLAGDRATYTDFILLGAFQWKAMHSTDGGTAVPICMTVRCWRCPRRISERAITLMAWVGWRLPSAGQPVIHHANFP